MRGFMIRLAVAVALTAALAIGGASIATGAGARTASQDDGGFRATLTGYQEVPAVSTPASGSFRAALDPDGTVSWELTYRDLEGDVTQAHIHLGQRGVNGGVSAFLCSNLAAAPAGTQPCPPPPATISGTIAAADVVGPPDQGIEPGELEELVRAMQARVTYANVHSTKFPGGEVRGQIERGERRD